MKSEQGTRIKIINRNKNVEMIKQNHRSSVNRIKDMK